MIKFEAYKNYVVGTKEKISDSKFITPDSEMDAVIIKVISAPAESNVNEGDIVWAEFRDVEVEDNGIKYIAVKLERIIAKLEIIKEQNNV